MIKPVFERPLAAINLNNTNTELVSKDISPVHRGGRSKKSMNKFFCVCGNFLSEKLLKWIAQLWIRDFIVSTYIWKRSSKIRWFPPALASGLGSKSNAVSMVTTQSLVPEMDAESVHCACVPTKLDADTDTVHISVKYGRNWRISLAGERWEFSEEI